MMVFKLTREQVQAIAPDTASIKAGSSLATTNKWLSLGVSQEALWGECKGSGKKPYQTQIELCSLASRCSCPSRKFPCKHALGLLFLHADQVTELTTLSEAPLWVHEWLQNRQVIARKKEEKKKSLPQSTDPVKEAALFAKRKETRWKRTSTGIEELQRWLIDLFGQGLATYQLNQVEGWRLMAARMHDAQAPKLGRMMLDALHLMESGKQYQEEAIEKLGLIQLLIESTRRYEYLSAEQQMDIETALGWTTDKEMLLRTAQPVSDHWHVLGQIHEKTDEQLSERRIWLWGEITGRYALLLDFSFKGQGFEYNLNNHAVYEATLVFYPGSVPLRALIQEHRPVAAAFPIHTIHDSVKTSLDSSARLLAHCPWQPYTPAILPASTILPHEEKWFIQTDTGCFPLQIDAHNLWQLLAFSGNSPVTLFAEWNGWKFRPLSAQRSTAIKDFYNCWTYSDINNQ